MTVLGAPNSGKSTCFKHLTVKHALYGAVEHPDLTSKMTRLRVDELWRWLASYDSSLDETLPARRFEDEGTVLDGPEANLVLDDAELDAWVADLKRLWAKHGHFWPLPLGHIDTRSGGLLEHEYDEPRSAWLESAPYLAAHAKRLLLGEELTRADLMSLNIRTLGIHTRLFNAVSSSKEVLPTRIVDLGGQRRERKRWIHNFIDVSLLLFVVDLPGYCLPLYEDENVCRLQEQLTLWGEVTRTKFLKETPFLLILNQYDRFANMIPRHPFVAMIVDPEASEAPVANTDDALLIIRGMFEKAFGGNRELFMVTTTLAGGRATPLVHGRYPKHVYDAVPDVAAEMAVATTLPTDLVGIVESYVSAAGEEVLSPPVVARPSCSDPSNPQL
jgi:GTPase SAR1 family protein